MRHPISLLCLPLFLTGCATSPASTAPDADHWHVIPLTQGGPNNLNPSAILLDSKTGETWSLDSDRTNWNPVGKR